MTDAAPILGLLIPIVIVPTALGIRFARQLRQMEHTERMKALELGRTLPQDEPWCTPAKISLAIGCGVPLGALFCAWMATQAAGYRDGIWVGAAMVGVAGVISGSALAAKHFSDRIQAEAVARGDYAKSPIDADAFDVVGRRG